MQASDQAGQHAPTLAADHSREAAYYLVAGDLLAAGDGATAASVLAEGLRREPTALALQVLRARVAERLGNWDAAVHYWQAAGAAHPDLSEAFLRSGSIQLRILKQPQAAEATLAEASSRFPGDAKIAEEYAWCAAVRRDSEAAAQRYWHAHQISPDNPTFLAGHAAALRDLKRFDEAETVLASALARFGHDFFFMTIYAWNAHFRGDATEAERRWRIVMERFPDKEDGYRWAGSTLINELRKPEDGLAVVEAGLLCCPDSLPLAILKARATEGLGQWESALALWNDLVARLPEDDTIRNGRGNAEMRVRLLSADTLASGGTALHPERPAPSSAPPVSPGAAREFMATFESLGMNCEFGLVQRHFGTEPLGLLRWNAIHPPDLARGLDQRFADIGKPENVMLETASGEYIIQETLYHMSMHSFLYEKDTHPAPEQLRRQFARRLRFLRDKLIEDLTEARKIFVYQYPRLLTGEEMDAIQHGVAGYGPGVVLFVNDLAPDMAPGMVVQAGPVRLQARIDRLLRGEPWSEISFDLWMRICRAASDIVRGTPG